MLQMMTFSFGRAEHSPLVGLNNALIVTERNSYGLGYHNRQLDLEINLSQYAIEIKTSNTKGSNLVPYFGQLK